MAKVLQGVFGGFSGSMGNVTGASWKGINYMRLKAVSVANPKTAGQVTQRTKFAATVILAQILLATLIKPLWDRFAVKQSGYNDFVGTNTEFMLPIGTRDFSKLVMSKGKMAPTAINSWQLDPATTTVSLAWLDDSGEGYKLSTDKAYVVFWNETQDILTTSPQAQTRANGNIIATMPKPTVSADVFHMYLCFMREDGTVVSDNSYATDMSS